MHVLIMTENWQAALACIQSFGRRGHHVSVLHAQKLSPHAYSSLVKQRIPFYDSSRTRTEQALKLLQILQTESVDLVIPISDEDAHLLAECKLRQPDQKGLICPSLACVELARDRKMTENFCRANGIRIPESIQVSSQAEALTAASQLGFPMVIKKSYSVTSQGVSVVNKEQDIAQLEQFFSTGQALQAQQFIQGEFVGVTGFSWQGQLKGSFTFRAAYEHSRVGTPPYAYSEEGNATATLLADIVNKLNWSGGIDLDLLRDTSGTLYLLEINPRLSGTSVFPLKLDIDLPRYYEAALDDSFDKLPVPPPIKSPVLFISFQEEIALLSTNPQTAFPTSMELRRNSNFVESLFLDDPGLTRNQFTQFLNIAWFTPRATP